MSVSQTIAAKLKDGSLLRAAGLIGGTWIDNVSDGRRFEILDPATGDKVATAPEMACTETEAAINAAYSAFKSWAALTGKARSAVLRRWYDLIVANVDDLAIILTAEMGKPLAEARGEVLYGAAYIEWFAEEAKRIYGDTIPGHQHDKRIIVLKQPIGVVGVITPWNFPNAMIARKLAPALAVGCTVVAKPAEQTPLSAVALAILAERAGIPPGVLNVIVGSDGPAIGRTLCASEKVRKISFTGSTEVGRILMRQSAAHIKKVSLELGGNAPFIVFDDADMDAAIEGAIQSKFRNAGQTCVCANRIYVQSGIYDEFARRLTSRVSRLNVASGFDAGVDIGPLIDQDSLRKVERHVADVLAKGGTIALGGKLHPLGGTFYEPTVLTGVNAQMTIAGEETFGPVAPLFRFEDVDDVIAQANDTIFGLAAYFYARDLSRVWKVAEALEYGIIGINTGLISTEVAPFGGVKQSGQGREGSKYGAEDYLEIKYLCMQV
ncbi:MAG: NAD-dependent succinate-semialdehyde dehydrogenase [Bradyrhizobium sp.]|uniref:NAD-dependent succinate-semialdehyde dehydrogenase n=1 Tax=Bradyrhizobium sp. TaxID=376 RepID=UPI0025C29070|nr:NAD-dependent succinate-semialdehyde dehydrogenase [Bradyrhizobium sp.]MBI5260758.1 NAD-dependent succinate-semialdehyde dehydrogenase [Bradyrhizobium sp.]